MKELFVPYTGDRPAITCINGHKFVIIAEDDAVIERELSLIGADHIRTSDIPLNSEEDYEAFVTELAEETGAGVIFANGGTGISELLQQLELQLPWIH